MDHPAHFPDEIAPASQPQGRRSAYLTWYGFVAAAGAGLLTKNPFLTALAIVVLPVLALMTWRRGEPPALWFACVMQWLQAAAGIFYVDSFGLSLVEAFGSTELQQATLLSLLGVVSLAVGMRIALFRAPPSQGNQLLQEAHAIQVYKAFTAYLVGFAVSLICAVLAPRAAAASQIVLFIGTLKWVLLFIFAYSVLETGRGYMLVVFAAAAETAVGLLGFFAGFKGVFLVFVVVLLTSPAALRGRRLVFTIATAVILLALGSVWTAVKSDYREFLSQGFRSQEVLVPVEERVGKLQDLVAGFDSEQLVAGFEAMILRISYVQYFALTIAHVPSSVPHENGALWLGALKHIVTPRFLFPNKPVIDDSERTSFYTGLEVSGTEQGTSIGIGYFGESYIDFGPVFMFLPILLLGVFYGLVYRCLIVRARYKLLGAAIVTSMMIFGGSAIETSNIKILGGNVVVLLVSLVFYFFGGPVLMRWLTANDGQ